MKKALLAGFFCGALAAPAAAKVVFTGYGDLRYNLDTKFDLGDSPGVLGAFRITDPSLRSRGASFDSIGLFATTSLNDQALFQMDVTYRQVGQKANEIRLQYVYLEYTPRDWIQIQAGRFQLPFGYLNQNRHYPFQRVSVTPPVFHNGILGLPISDIGAGATLRGSLGPVAARLDLYSVDGYGPVSGSTTSFRNASAPGGLNLSNNLGSSNANTRVSVGGRLSLSPASRPGLEAGVSYHGGHWDPLGSHFFRMLNGHAHAGLGRFDFLAEYLLMKVEGDQGFAASFARPDWTSSGYFVEASWEATRIKDRPLLPWARWENYGSHPDGGGSGREKLRNAAGGLTFKASGNVSLKAEYSHLYYLVPLQAQGNLRLEGRSVLLGLTLTF